MRYLGFVVSSTLAFLIITLFMARMNRKVSVANIAVWLGIIIVEVVALYLVFSRVLFVPLPEEYSSDAGDASAAREAPSLRTCPKIDSMRITSIEERTVSIASDIRNAYVSFANMTVSVVKISTDVEQDGRPRRGVRL